MADKQGFLYKRGKINTAYKQRWMVLQKPQLKYFETRGDKTPNGSIDLSRFSLKRTGNAVSSYSVSCFAEPCIGRIYI